MAKVIVRKGIPKFGTPEFYERVRQDFKRLNSRDPEDRPVAVTITPKGKRFIHQTETEAEEN